MSLYSSFVTVFPKYTCCVSGRVKTHQQSTPIQCALRWEKEAGSAFSDGSRVGKALGTGTSEFPIWVLTILGAEE